MVNKGMHGVSYKGDALHYGFPAGQATPAVLLVLIGMHTYHVHALRKNHVIIDIRNC